MIYSINGQKFDSDFLEHHGIKGQKWGVRRYQNLDGTWTELGKQMRRNDESSKKAAKAEAEAKLLQRWYAKDFDSRNEQDNKLIKLREKIISDIFDWGNHTTENPMAHSKEMDKLVRQYDSLCDTIRDIHFKAAREAHEAASVYREKGSKIDPRPGKINLELLKKWTDAYNKKYDEVYKNLGYDSYRKKQKAAEKKINAQILRELGFEVTDKNIELIRGFWLWD